MRKGQGANEFTSGDCQLSNGTIVTPKDAEQFYPNTYYPGIDSPDCTYSV